MVFGIVDTIRAFVDWFISSAPKPFRLMLFLFLMFTAGAVVNDVLTRDYVCFVDESDDYFLAKELVSDRALGIFQSAYFASQNVTVSGLVAGGLNESTATELVNTITGITLVDGFLNGVSNFFGGIIGLNVPVDEGFNLVQRLSSPELFYCDDLYEELDGVPNGGGDGELRDDLGLFDGCSLGDIPTREEWLSVAYVPDGGEINQLFSVACVGSEKELTLFGFPMFDWRFWFVVLSLFILFVAGAKWRQWVEMH